MEVALSHSRRSRPSADAVLEQVASDLNGFLARGQDKKTRLKFLSKKIEVHEKTLRRICAMENKPSYITVFKIYRHLLNETDDAQVLERCPPLVRDYLKNANPQSFKKGVSYSFGFEREVAANPIVGEIVVLASTGVLKATAVRQRFGEYGIQVAERLVEKGVLQRSSADEYSAGRVSINMSPETLVSLGVQLVETYVKPKNSYVMGLNFIGFFAEGLTEEIYQKWLKIDAEAFAQKVALAKANSGCGGKRAFTFVATDTLALMESI